MNSTTMPTISIVMATYNRANILSQTIANIMEQEYRPLELIVVNDGSKDNTSLVLKELQTLYDFVIIENTQNQGLQKSLNKGLHRASGKYIARIDDHDKWLRRDKLSRQVAHLEAHPEVGMIGTGYQLNEKNILNPLTDQDIRKQILFRCPFCHVTVLMRTELVKKLGGYDETLPYSEDWELWLRIGEHSQLANLSDITVALTEEKSSLSNAFFTKQLPLNRSIIQKHLRAYPNGFKARLYHAFVHYFFRLFPVNGMLHGGMQKIFRLFFLNSKSYK